jgi:hypothetical protein
VALGLLAACTKEGSGEPQNPPPEVPAPNGGTVIGPAGGQVQAGGGVVLVVPPGALTQDVTITVQKGGAIPAGYTGYSDLYTFGPAGTRFAKAVRLELPFSGDATRATVFFSKESGPGHDALPTTVAGSVAQADILHLGSAFVGTPSPVTSTGGVWGASNWNQSTWQ